MNRLFARRVVNVTRNFWASPFNRARVIQLVPALGESITEGSISKWMKQPGERVKVDEIIVVVETDKVTVDIKSEHDGVFVKGLASENVSVGASLFELDTDLTVSVDKTPLSGSPSNAVASGSAAVKPTSHHAESSSSLRSPLIKFVGKRSLQKPSATTPSCKTTEAACKEKKAQAQNAAAATNANASKKAASVNGEGVSFFSLKAGAWHGRPRLSAVEMDAIDSGGASLFNPVVASKPKAK